MSLPRRRFRLGRLRFLIRRSMSRAFAKQVLAPFPGRLRAPAEIDGTTTASRIARRLGRRTRHVPQDTDKTLPRFAGNALHNDEPWTTFGGDPSRNRTLSIGMAWRLAEDGPAWRVKLPSLTPPGKTALPGRGTLTRDIAFHPIIVHDQVLIADHRSVVSYHLKTGKEAFRYGLKTAGLIDPGAGLQRAIRAPRFTLSADRARSC